MPNRTYAMDTHFMVPPDNVPLPAAQAAMVREADYSDYYVAEALQDLVRWRALRQAAQAEGLGINAIYEPLSVAAPPEPEALAQMEALLTEAGPGCRLELGISHGDFNSSCGDTTLDDKALAWLEPIANILGRTGCQGSLYPHFGFTMESFTDALRLVRKLNHPVLGVTFCGYHWFRVGKENPVDELLASAGNLLNAVNLCGSRRLAPGAEPPSGLNPTIEALDAGEIDNCGILATLRKLDYQGPVGVQGYAVTVPPAEALPRSRRWLAQQGW